MTHRPARLALISAAYFVAISPLMAADAARGGRLAQQWCANCHVIGTPPAATATIQQGPPSFPTIASHLTGDQLRAFLTHPHPPMTDLSLTRSEIDDLIAYIETFR